MFSKARANLFQDIEGLNSYLASHGAPCFEKTMGVAPWEEIKWFFQARHLYVHNAGVIDERFALKQPAFSHMKGRILPLDSGKLFQNINTLGQLCQELDNWLDNHSES